MTEEKRKEARSSGPEETPTATRMKELGTASANALSHEAKGEHQTESGSRWQVPMDQVEQAIDDWPEAPRNAVENMLNRYGPPNEATPTKLFWYNQGTWKRIVVTRDVVTHHFPMPHIDYISQSIDYRIPIEKVEEVTRMDGSCLIDRTAGEATARCDSEWANIITLNMMHEIVTGKKTADEARKAFADAASAYALGRPSPYAERLQFDVPEGNTAYLDDAMVGKSMVEQGVQKMKDAILGEERNR